MIGRLLLALTSILLASPRHVPATRLPRYNHVILVIEENQSYTDIIGSSHAPFINGTLLPVSATAANYRIITHYSLPNYLGLINGRDYKANDNIVNDCPPAASCRGTGSSIVKALAAVGKTWRYYGESMPVNCAKTGSDPYAVRHNPFAYYGTNTITGRECLTNDKPFSAFAHDLSQSQLPAFSVIVPDTCHDMHNGCALENAIGRGDSWLKTEVYNRLVRSKVWTGGSHILFIVVWDEGSGGSLGEDCLHSTDTSCQVPAILRANDGTTKCGVTFGSWGGGDSYSHFSLLATIEDVLGASRLRSVATTPPLSPAFALHPNHHHRC